MAARDTDMDFDDDPSHLNWEFSIGAGLNSDGWQWNLGITWMPIPYFGIGMSVGLDSEIQEIADWDWSWIYDDYDYGYSYSDYDDDYCTRLFFKPSILLRSPEIIKISDVTLHLFAQPAMVMAAYAEGSKDSNWLYWEMGGGVMAAAGRVTLSLGYSYSNFSLLEGNPYSHYGGYSDDSPHYTHSVFFSLGYKF